MILIRKLLPCDIDQINVLKINISYNVIIPKEVYNLKNLTKLENFYNKLNKNIRNLVKLYYVYHYNDSFNCGKIGIKFESLVHKIEIIDIIRELPNIKEMIYGYFSNINDIPKGYRYRKSKTIKGAYVILI